MKDRHKALFYVLVFSLFWSINITIGKLLLQKGIQPFSILIQSQVLVVVLSGVYVLLFNHKKLNSISKKSLPLLLIFGAVGSGLGVGVSYLGLNLSSSINYGFIIKTSAVFTILIAHFWHPEDRIDSSKILLSIFFLSGIYLLSTNGQLIMPHHGDLLILFGALMLGVSNNIVKQLTKFHVDPAVLVLFRMLGAAFVSVLFVLWLKSPIFTPEVFPILLMNSVIMFIFLYAVNMTIKFSSASYLSMMSMVVPVIVSLFGIIFLDESMGIYQLSGGLMILFSGIILENYRRRRL